MTTTKQCQACQQFCEAEALFCQQCGAPFSSRKRCMQCGHTCSGEANFCDNCCADFARPVAPKAPNFLQRKCQQLETWFGPAYSKRRIAFFVLYMLVIACGVGTFIYFNL